MKTLNIIGCGNVGQTLARLWTQHRLVAVQCVLNRSLASSRRAVEFVGEGRPVESYAQLQPADVVMTSTSDEAIGHCCERLCATGLVRDGVIVFHCSGALASTVLEPARARGARIASLHPVKSFADPTVAVETFSGTFCALEGDPEATTILRDLLERCGAVSFSIDRQSKAIYHAGTVFACNYLVALVEIGLRCFQRAGLDRADALQILRPIVGGTVENVFRLGPARALTGPIARGECAVVAHQCAALAEWDPEMEHLYRALGRTALELSAAQGNASAEALAAINEILRRE